MLEEKRRMQNVLERTYEAGEATEEEMLDGVVALGDAYMSMDEYDEGEGGVRAPAGGEQC